MSFDPSVSQALLPFHAISGCDTVSFLAGHSKKATWKVFLKQNQLLVDLGIGEISDEVIQSAEKFICRLYGSSEDDINKVRVHMFTGSTTKLPPTSDALRFHIQRSHYQAAIWRQSHVPHPNLPQVTSYGWKLAYDTFVPILTSLDAVPKSCLAIVSCSCSTGCPTLRCKCRKSKLVCTEACKCTQTRAQECMNRNSAPDPLV